MTKIKINKTGNRTKPSKTHPWKCGYAATAFKSQKDDHFGYLADKAADKSKKDMKKGHCAMLLRPV